MWLVPARANGQVEVARTEALDQEAAGQAKDVNLNGRVNLGEALEDAGEVTKGIIVRSAEPDGALHGGGVKAGPDLIVKGEELAGANKKKLAVCGEVNGAPFAAGQETLAEHRFKALELHTNGGLGSANAVGGTGKAAFVGNEDKRAKEVGVEAEG